MPDERVKVKVGQRVRMKMSSRWMAGYVSAGSKGTIAEMTDSPRFIYVNFDDIKPKKPFLKFGFMYNVVGELPDDLELLHE